MVIFTSIFSYEVLLQDNNFYVPGYAETLLNYEINKLEVINNFVNIIYKYIYIYYKEKDK